MKFDNRLAEIQQQKEGQRRETVSPNEDVKQDIKRSGEEQEGQQNREQIQNRAPVQERQDHQPAVNRVQDEQNRVPAHQEQQQDRVPVQKPINEEEQRMQQPSEDQQQQGKVGRVDKDVAVQSQERVQEPDLNKMWEVIFLNLFEPVELNVPVLVVPYYTCFVIVYFIKSSDVENYYRPWMTFLLF